MDNVIYINRKQSPEHQRSQGNELYFDHAGFLLSVVLTIVAPTIAYCAYQGPVPPVVFAATALVGVAIGVANYLKSPDKPLSCFGASTGQRPRTNTPSTPPPSTGTTTKLAA